MYTSINIIDLIQTYALVKNMVIYSDNAVINNIVIYLDNTVINNMVFNSNLSLSE